MPGHIGNLFVKRMRQVTKGHLYYLLGVLLCNVKAKGPVSFMKRLQRSPTRYLIPSDGCVSFCEKFVVRGREF